MILIEGLIGYEKIRGNETGPTGQNFSYTVDGINDTTPFQTTINIYSNFILESTNFILFTLKQSQTRNIIFLVDL